MYPKVSVVVPIYKVEKYLHRCVDSILEQTYENLEIILVNDGSPDRCGGIAERYKAKDHRIKVIHKENGGLSDARNQGMKHVSGKSLFL
ncbi:glycosyltransferase family 2 protein [Bacillus sp. Cs-700]|uniref:glycosyltransferase family 2 protein n=1 Tax=Bacillus sp. Cs-700 TaxID=2589818 RepID=UPI001F61DB3A|nr:glycosyltransferase family 2 protein [Bacillus sp. Cs-700]